MLRHHNRILKALKCEESPFRLLVNKMRARGFLERVGRLYKMEGDVALKLGACRLGRLVHESVEGGGRDALNGVWE
jgi:hypothetical protein